MADGNTLGLGGSYKAVDSCSVIHAEGSEVLVRRLQEFVKDRLALYKYPRWIEFRAELPKTATGKIQRFMLRD